MGTLYPQCCGGDPAESEVNMEIKQSQQESLAIHCAKLSELHKKFDQLCLDHENFFFESEMRYLALSAAHKQQSKLLERYTAEMLKPEGILKTQYESEILETQELSAQNVADLPPNLHQASSHRIADLMHRTSILSPMQSRQSVKRLVLNKYATVGLADDDSDSSDVTITPVLDSTVSDSLEEEERAEIQRRKTDRDIAMAHQIEIAAMQQVLSGDDSLIDGDGHSESDSFGKVDMAVIAMHQKDQAIEETLEALNYRKGNPFEMSDGVGMDEFPSAAAQLELRFSQKFSTEELKVQKEEMLNEMQSLLIESARSMSPPTRQVRGSNTIHPTFEV